MRVMLKKSLQWLAALLLCLCALEVVLRLTVETPIPFQHHARLGWMPKPFSSGLYTAEGRSITSYNERGFRDRGIEARKQGELRILCLGDSFVEGQQMDAAATFPRTLEHELNERVSRGRWPGVQSVRVFNGGRAHTSNAHNIVLASEYRDIFDPDWVVVLFREGSFLSSMAPEKEVFFRVTAGEVSPVVRWRGEHTSQLKERLVTAGLRSSAALHYGYVRAAQILSMPATPQHPRPAKPSVTPQAVVDYTIRSLVERYPRIIFVHLPRQDIIGPVVAGPSRDEVVLRASTPASVPVVYLREAINRAFEREHRPVYGFFNTVPGEGHANATAHRLIADSLVELFETKLAGVEALQ